MWGANDPCPKSQIDDESRRGNIDPHDKVKFEEI